MKILIDAGHGIETSANKSPDGTLYEWEWAMEIAERLRAELERRGIAATLIKPEKTNIPLQTRVARINRICRESGSWNCLLVSIHLNADGKKSWSSAKGFTVFVSKNASQNSQRMAETMVKLAEKRGMTGNRCIPRPDKNGNRYWTWSWKKDADIYILKRSNCPAVLTESGFMGNKDDCKWLSSEEGKTAMVAFHADAIEQYIKQGA